MPQHPDAVTGERVAPESPAPGAPAPARPPRSAGVRAWVRLVRVVQKVARGGGPTLRGLGLTGPQFDALATVGAHEGLTQQELADRLGVTKGNVSQVLARLEGAGLVERRADGAANQLALSAAGRRLVAEALPGHDAHIDACFAALTAAEREQLLRLLTKLDRALD